MSSSSSVSDEKSASGSSECKSKPGKKSAAGMTAGMTLVVVILGTWTGVAGAGGVAYFLVKSGKIQIGAPNVAGGGGSEAKTVREITLDPILANLADAGGHAYVRLGLRVEVMGTGASVAEAAETAKPVTSKEAGVGGGNSSSELESSIRDTVLAVLGRQTSADLLGPDGKEHLKIELKEAIERGGVRVDVKDLFFTDFLVQI
jgi:flagellar FliL protein